MYYHVMVLKYNFHGPNKYLVPTRKSFEEIQISNVFITILFIVVKWLILLYYIYVKRNIIFIRK